MDTEARKKLIDKIQKLMAMAEGTTFTEEAKAHRAKAEELMAKHAIELQEMRKKSEYITWDMDVEDPESYELYMANAVAKFNGLLCVHYTYVGRYKTIKLCGTYSDITAFQYMHDSVERQLGTALCKEMESRRYMGTRDKAQFMLGFAIGLNNKVDALIRGRNNYAQANALMVIDEIQQARNFYQQTEGKLRNGNNKCGIYDPKGVKAGLEANLNKGVTKRGEMLQIA
jgi:hypothetical protein